MQTMFWFQQPTQFAHATEVSVHVTQISVVFIQLKLRITFIPNQQLQHIVFYYI